MTPQHRYILHAVDIPLVSVVIEAANMQDAISDVLSRKLVTRDGDILTLDLDKIFFGRAVFVGTIEDAGWLPPSHSPYLLLELD